MAKKQAFEVVTATLDYWAGGRPVRRVAGDVVSDVPERSLPWLLAKGAIRPAGVDLDKQEAAGEAKED